VPLLIAGPQARGGVDLGTRETFADVGATVADALSIRWTGPGASMLRAISISGG